MKRPTDQCCGNCVYFSMLKDHKKTTLYEGVCVWGQHHLPTCIADYQRVYTSTGYGTGCPCWQRKDG